MHYELCIKYRTFALGYSIYMSQAYFRFRQFCVWHDRCAMKVGTDGVLLGAWTDMTGCRRILDIGSGSGLIALMAAQKVPTAQVTGIEIDEEAVRQSIQNVEKSPFSSRIKVLHQDINTYLPECSFDCIVCNPPFYTESVLPPDASRLLARNTASLSFGNLIQCVKKILTSDGTFSVVLPYASASDFIGLCLLSELFLSRRCDVSTVDGKAPKRTLLSFSGDSSRSAERETLVLHTRDNQRTDAYQQLTKDFYLP